jgi:hypothetical protein
LCTFVIFHAQKYIKIPPKKPALRQIIGFYTLPKQQSTGKQKIAKM